MIFVILLVFFENVFGRKFSKIARFQNPVPVPRGLFYSCSMYSKYSTTFGSVHTRFPFPYICYETCDVYYMREAFELNNL